MKPEAVYFYIRGRARSDAQREKLQAEFPQGIAMIDTDPPRMLEKLIEGAGPGDMIAFTSIEAAPELTAAAYTTICQKGAALYFQQQPCLNSEIFTPEIMENRTTRRTAERIITRQLEAERGKQAQQRAKEKAGRETAKAEGRPGGRKQGEKQTSRKQTALQGLIHDLMAQGLNGTQILNIINTNPDGPHITHNTLYKYMKIIKTQDAQEV